MVEGRGCVRTVAQQRAYVGSSVLPPGTAGNATDDSMWRTPQFSRNEAVAWDVNSGPPSEVSSSLMPYVTKIRRRAAMSPAAPWDTSSTMGQFLYLSTTTK